MNCPLCIDQTLDITHRHGIELDICPRCRGIWLDRGEIDRLIAEDTSPPPPSLALDRGDADAAGPQNGGMKVSKNDKKQKKQKKKKKSLADRLGDALEEVLDELT